MSTQTPPARRPGIIKRFLPRGLYGRAALILILPVVTLQLVISLSFIQRHFEGVTRQMTLNVADEVAVIAETHSRDVQASRELAAALGLRLLDPAPAPDPALASRSGRAFWDLSGRAVEQVLREHLPMITAISLEGGRDVVLWLDGDAGDFGISFSRRKVTASNPHQLLVLMLVFGAAMTFIAYLFLRNQLRPIARLAAASEQYGHGRITPYHPGGAREVRAAGRAFLQMRARIEEQNYSRQLMLSGISHDLRTPLTRLRLGLEMTESEDSAALRRDVDEMERMIAAFLDYARGVHEEAFEKVDVAALVRQVAEDAARTGRKVGVLPVVGTPTDARLRPLAIRRALGNLVSNALRHGDQVQIGLVFTPGEIRIAVEDDGPGIASEQAGEAVQPFVRLDDARNQDRGAGVGLGLAIVADITRAHGGTFLLDRSAGLGGLRAELVLPR